MFFFLGILISKQIAPAFLFSFQWRIKTPFRKNVMDDSIIFLTKVICKGNTQITHMEETKNCHRVIRLMCKCTTCGFHSLVHEPFTTTYNARNISMVKAQSICSKLQSREKLKNVLVRKPEIMLLFFHFKLKLKVRWFRKYFFVSSDSSKKRTNKFVFYLCLAKKNEFVRLFFGRIRGYQKSFRNYV